MVGTMQAILLGKALLGCEEVNSKVAKWLGLCKPSFSGRSVVRGFADLPHGHDLNPEFLQLAGEGCHGWMPTCNDNSMHWFFSWTPTDKEKETQKDASKMKDLVLSKTWTSKNPDKKFDQVGERSEISSLVCTPLRYRWPFELLWTYISKGNVSVASDALHPITPDVGDGGCSALEDAVVLSRCLVEELLVGGGRKTGEGQYCGRIKRWQRRGCELAQGCVLSVTLARILLSRTQFDCGEL